MWLNVRMCWYCPLAAASCVFVAHFLAKARGTGLALFEVMQDDRIDFISAYCDGWCERCAFTARCSTFAVRVATSMCDDPCLGEEVEQLFPDALKFIRPGFDELSG